MSTLNRLVIFGVFAAACGDNHSHTTLVNIEQEPEGANCEWGGVAVQTGVDSDHNGELDADEVLETEYVCNGTSTVRCTGGNIHSGTVTIRDQADLAPLTGVTCIDGDLIIAGTSLTGLSELNELTA